MYMEQEFNKIKNLYNAVCKILDFTRGMNSVEELTSNKMAWDAVKMNLVVIYETYQNIDKKLIKNSNSVPWHEIDEYKPKLENQYLGFDGDEIWKLIQNRLPQFKEELKTVI